MLCRRKFGLMLGGAIAIWSVETKAQQRLVPTIGLINPASLEARRELIAAFHRGLMEAGYVEGQNLAIEYRWAEGKNDQLPIIAADLVQRV